MIHTSYNCLDLKAHNAQNTTSFLIMNASLLGGGLNYFLFILIHVSITLLLIT